MPPKTWAWSTVQDWNINLEDIKVKEDIVLDEENIIDPNVPKTWAWSVVDGWEIKEIPPVVLPWTEDEIIPPAWEITPEQQAEFDRQQAEWDKKIADEEAKRIADEKIIADAEIKRVADEKAVEEIPSAWEDVVIEEKIEDIASFKKAWGSLENLSTLITNAYWWVPEIKWDKIIWEINWVPFEWIIDEAWNPIRTQIDWWDEKEWFMNSLTWMFIWWSSKEDINKFLLKNKDIYLENRDEIIASMLDQWLNQDTLIRQQNIAKMTWQELNKSIIDGSINIWDLSPEAKVRYDEYNNINRNNDIITSDTVNDLVYDNTLTDFETISWTYTTNAKWIIDEINALYDTEEMKEANNKVSDKYLELTKKQREYKNLWDKIRADNKWVPASLVNAKVAKAERELRNEINDIIDEYNVEVTKFQSLERIADKKAEALWVELKLEESIYTNKLKQYNTNKADMKIEERLEFLEQNKILAEERALINSKNLYKYQNSLKESWTKWTWESREDWLYFLKEDWSFDKVVNWGYTKWLDWNTTYIYTDKDNNPIIETYDVNWQIIWASTDSNISQKQVDLLNAPNWTIIPTRLKTTTNKNWWKECAEYMNDIFADQTWVKMWDTYQSKLNVANEEVWRLWSMAVWQPNPNNKEFAKFWHAWVIVWESENGKDWHIKSSNLNLDGKISIVSVPKTVIDWYRSTTLFDNKLNKSYTQSQMAQMDALDIKDIKWADEDALASNWLTVTDLYAFRSDKWEVTKEKRQQFNNILLAIDRLNIDDRSKWLDSAVWASFQKFFDIWEQTFIPWSDASNFARNFDALRDLITLPSLESLKGAMSDKDIQFLRNSATALDLSMSEKEFIKTVKWMQDKYREVLGLETNKTWEIIFTDKDWVTYDMLWLKSELLRLVETNQFTKEQVNDFLKRNNIILQ